MPEALPLILTIQSPGLVKFIFQLIPEGYPRRIFDRNKVEEST
jgi:hypothetical protein